MIYGGGGFGGSETHGGGHGNHGGGSHICCCGDGIHVRVCINLLCRNSSFRNILSRLAHLKKKTFNKISLPI